MEGNEVCDEDGNQAAVCCCICRYPIPNLCEEHLLKHNTDTELLHHFHLPLYATRLIDSMETKNCCELWLFKLHKTYRNLRAQCHNLDRVEERLECLRQELFHQIDEETSEAAFRFRHLRQELTAHVEAAIEATSTHALEQWVPDTELSHLIWHFDINNPASLVTVWIDKREVGNTLLVSATSRLESLQHLTFSESQGNNLAALQRQFEEVICENSALKAEVARLQEEAEKLRQDSSIAVNDKKLTEATAALKLADDQIKTLKTKLTDSAQTHATEIEALKQQIVKINFECIAEAAATDAKMTALKRECDARVNELKSQVLSLQEDLRQEKLLKKQELFEIEITRERLAREAELQSSRNPQRQEDAILVGFDEQGEGQKQETKRRAEPENEMERNAAELEHKMKELTIIADNMNRRQEAYSHTWMNDYLQLDSDYIAVKKRQEQLQREKSDLQRDIGILGAYSPQWKKEERARKWESFQKKEEDILNQQETLLTISKELKAQRDSHIRSRR